MTSLLKEFWDNKLFEGVSPVVYHVSQKPILNLRLNELFGTLNETGEIKGKSFKQDKFWFVSLARSTTSSYFLEKIYCIIFELDGKKLNKKFPGSSVDFFHSHYLQRRKELEDRIYLNKPTIKNLNKFMRRIIVPLDDWHANQVDNYEFGVSPEVDEKFTEEIIAAIEYGKKYNIRVDFIRMADETILASRRPIEYEKAIKPFVDRWERLVDCWKLKTKSPIDASEGEEKFYWNLVGLSPNIRILITLLFLGEVKTRDIYSQGCEFEIMYDEDEEKHYLETPERIELSGLPHYIKRELANKLKEFGATSPTIPEINRILKNYFSWGNEENAEFFVDEINEKEIIEQFSEETKKLIIGEPDL